MRYLCPLLNFPTTTMSWNLSVLWFSFLIHSPPTVGFNTRAEEKKRMVKFAYFFSSLCPLESDPRRAAFVYHRSQLLLKVLHKQPVVHISLPAPSFSHYPHHTLSHGDGCSPITQYKITALFFLSSLFPDHIFVNSSFLKLSSNYIIQICYFTANPDW